MKMIEILKLSNLKNNVDDYKIELNNNIKNIIIGTINMYRNNGNK